MSESESIEVDIYKTPRRAETFLFVPAGMKPDAWPEGLAETFHPAEHVMRLTLTPQQALAAQPASEVMASIAERGYLLQLPPHPVAADRQRSTQRQESTEC